MRSSPKCKFLFVITNNAAHAKFLTLLKVMHGARYLGYNLVTLRKNPMYHREISSIYFRNSYCYLLGGLVTMLTSSKHAGVHPAYCTLVSLGPEHMSYKINNVSPVKKG